MAGKALWRRAYDAVERPVGTRLESAVQTEAFADAAGLLLRARAEVERRVERTTRHALHRVNLPAASDVSRLREQVGELHRTIRRLEDALAEARAAAPAAPAPAAARPATARRPRARSADARPAEGRA